MDAAACFADHYAAARGKFLAAADAAGLDVQSHAHPLLGPDGEPLAMDVARFGPADAQAVLLLSSGCHGVEGFCGSGVQVALLRDAAWHAAAQAAGVALVYVHALNPHGFAWWRRTTQENVDLNRNFVDFHAPLPANPAYDEIAHLLVPRDWPPAPQVDAAVQAFIAQRGMAAWQAAISCGQYAHPEGLFYGGDHPTWSQQVLRQVLHSHATRCARLGWIDFHTGLGPYGVGERIATVPDEPEALARAARWWGPKLTSVYDGSSTSPPLHGMLWRAAVQECPQAQFAGIALEYGTAPITDVLQALRADQWLENHPEVGAPQAEAIHQRMRAAFYPDDEAWRRTVLAQGVAAAHDGLRGLATDKPAG